MRTQCVGAHLRGGTRGPHLQLFNEKTTAKDQHYTWSRAGGGASVQSDVWLSGALRLRVVALDLLRLWLWHRQTVLSVSIRGRGGHQQRLLGWRGGRRQVQGSDLLGHQLLLDLVNEHQVIQLKGLTGHAQQKTATVCECHLRPTTTYDPG